MKRVYTLVFSAFLTGGSFFSSAQDFSNKGKEFYLCFPQHVPSGSNLATLSIFITSDKASSGTITMPNGAFSSTFNIPANGIQEIQIPWNTSIHISNAESNTVVNKSIIIRTDPGKPPVVAYAQQWAGFRSAATLLLPVNVLGKKYYAISFNQDGSNAGPSLARSQFQIIAIKNNTVVTVTPRKNGVVGTPFTVTFPAAGGVYQYQSTDANANNQDLTGTLIESISSGTGGCKPIAVFSGSSNMTIGIPGCNGQSFDPLWQQDYPVTSWGKNFGFIPFAEYTAGTSYRVMASEDNTNVYFNGALVATLNAGQIYPAAFTPNPVTTTTPINITSDKPVCVAQYSATQVCSGSNPPVGDPDMVILNPIEQNINDIIIFSSNLQAISRQWINVLLKTSAISSFTINGVIPSTAWQPFPGLPGYSYLRHLLPGIGSYRLKADSGFNAIAYGWGNFESYAYSAGTNVRDLYNQIGVVTPYGSATSPSVCKDLPSRFKISVPYPLDSMYWDFHGNQTPNVMISGPLTPIPPDSITIINGKQVYWYSLPASYIYSTVGSFPVTITLYAQNVAGCGTEQEIDFDVEVYNKPVADFSFTTNGCALSPVNFQDNSILNGRPALAWSWNFGDGNTSSLFNPSNTYPAQGTYTVKHTVLNDIGCLSDTATRVVTINDLPLAKFGSSSPLCVGKLITFTDSSGVSGGSTLAKWYWDFGDGSPAVIATSNAPQAHTYLTAGTYTVTLKVETNSGCQSNVFSRTITIYANPAGDFSLPVVCLPVGAAQFNDLSTISGGSTITGWNWNFGDGGNSSVQNPLHNYSSVGPFNVSLTVTTNQGCTDTKTKTLSSVYAQPQAAFTTLPGVCLGNISAFTDGSAAAGSSVTSWSWNFGDGNTSNVQNPAHTFAAAGTYTVTLNVTSATGCQTVNNAASQSVTIYRLPVAGFGVSSPVCVTKSVSFNDQSVANSGSINNWSWNFGDPSSGTANTSVMQSPAHIFSTSGTYNVTLTVTTGYGCTSPVYTMPVSVSVLPKAGFISPQVCLSDPQAPFTDTSSVTSGNIVAWSWNFGEPGSGANNFSTLQNPSHSYSTTGSYTATLAVITNNGCRDSIAQSFTVNGTVPVSNFIVQNPTQLCSNRDVSIANASTVDFGNIIRVEIYWDYTNDPTIKTTDPNPVPGKIYSHTYPEFGFPFTRDVAIRYVVYSGINCINSSERNITLLATPAVQFNPVTAVCSNLPSFQITQAQVLNGLPGVGVFTGTGVSPGGVFNPSSAGSGSHNIQYTFTSTNGCIQSATQTITVNPSPSANAGPDKFVLEGGSVTLTPALTAGFPVTYSWTPPTGLSNPNIATPNASPAADITYTLTVTSAAGCRSSDQVFVKMLKSFEIPNVFSPNGDGINDKWMIKYLESYPGCTVDVYNRYGQLVFHSRGYDKPWEGTYKGKEVPAGTYYYIVDPKNGRKPSSGFVDILR